ncbi:hypothetical protein Xhom_04714 [Xenorhabdus hominickii]|uniref:Uncharacterized protein n=1 Tax=Xenorhabdus hominickii TaxID=351679 RepID=A0A2G0PY24_XENHO|nr:hypothetical protein Xhom_04714 [Xenorhabdus hominickii]
MTGRDTRFVVPEPLDAAFFDSFDNAVKKRPSLRWPKSE